MRFTIKPTFITALDINSLGFHMDFDMGKTKTILKDKKINSKKANSKTVNRNKQSHEDTDSNQSQTQSDKDSPEVVQSIDTSNQQSNKETSQMVVANKGKEQQKQWVVKQEQQKGEGGCYFVDDAMQQQVQQSSEQEQNSSEQSSSSDSDEKQKNVKQQIQQIIRRRYQPIEEDYESDDSDDQQMYDLQQDQQIEDMLGLNEDDEDQDDQYEQPQKINTIIQKRIRQITDRMMPMPSPFHNQLIPLVKAHRFQQINQNYLDTLNKRPNKQVQQKHNKHVSFNSIITLKTFKKQQQASEILSRQQQKQSINYKQKPPTPKFLMQQQLLQKIQKQKLKREQQDRLQLANRKVADSNQTMLIVKSGINPIRFNSPLYQTKKQHIPYCNSRCASPAMLSTSNQFLDVNIYDQISFSLIFILANYLAAVYMWIRQ